MSVSLAVSVAAANIVPTGDLYRLPTTFFVDTATRVVSVAKCDTWRAHGFAYVHHGVGSVVRRSHSKLRE